MDGKFIFYIIVYFYINVYVFYEYFIIYMGT